MSVKKDYEIKTHTVTEKVLVKETRYCDICKKEIENNKPYWRLTTHHNDWDNDSIEKVKKSSYVLDDDKYTATKIG